MLPSAGAADHHTLTYLQRTRLPDRDRLEVDTRQRLHQAEAGFLVVAEHMTRRDLAVAEGEPDLFGFGDEITDGEDDATLADQDAIAGAFGAERLGRECVRRNDRTDADDRAQRAIEIIIVVFRFWLRSGRHTPVRLS